MKPKLSLGVLAYILDSDTLEMTRKALESYRGADELILVENGGQPSGVETDVLVRLNKNRGFTAGCNMIFDVARGDYIAIVSNDTYLISGDLHDLCVPGIVTSPYCQTQPHIETFSGSFFVVPRSVLEIVGKLNERMRIYWSDTEYGERIKETGVPFQRVNSVVTYHHIAQTVMRDKQDWGEDDGEIYKRVRAGR